MRAMSSLLVKIYDPNIVVVDTGFKSFMRFYEKLISLNE